MLCASAAETIGVAQALGSFRVNGSAVMGNATLFDGATVETAESSSRLRLSEGTRVELGPASKALVHGKRLSLERGATEVNGAAGYSVEARNLRIAADSGATAKVVLEGERTVLVAAANGAVRVFNEQGELLARVRPGMALSVLPAASALADESKLTGCLSKKEGRYLLTDATANVTVELRGGNLDPLVGRNVQMEGTVFRTATPIAGASQVIRVGRIDAVEGGNCAPPAAAETKPATASIPRPPAPVSEGGSKVSGATIGIIAAGAAGGGIGAVLATRKSSNSR